MNEYCILLILYKINGLFFILLSTKIMIYIVNPNIINDLMRIDNVIILTTVIMYIVNILYNIYNNQYTIFYYLMMKDLIIKIFTLFGLYKYIELFIYDNDLIIRFNLVINMILLILINIGYFFKYKYLRIIYLNNNNLLLLENNTSNTNNQENENRIKIVKYENNYIYEIKECIICLNDIGINNDKFKLNCNCNNIYHYNCIKEWIDNNNGCPTCRAELGV
jgi:hypothetical protein